MKLFIVAALMFPLTTVFTTLVWYTILGKGKEAVEAAWFYGLCSTFAVFGILYLLFGD